MGTKQRNSNLELMRIFAIWCIVVFHAAMNTNGCINFVYDFQLNMIPVFIFGSWGRLGVAIFIIVSAWYLVEKKEDSHRGKKILKISLTTIFYSLLVPLAFGIFGLKKIPVSIYVKAFVAPFIDEYWFVSSYLMLLLVYPFFNKLIKSLNMSDLFKLVITMILISDVLGGIVPSRVAKVCGEFMTFMTLYFAVAWLKQKPNNWFMKKTVKKIVLFFSVIVLLCITSCLAGTYFHVFFLQSIPVRIVNNNSLLIDILAILIFYYFQNIQIKYNSFINVIAKTSLGVYILHTQEVFSSDSWDKIFHLGYYFTTNNCVFYTVNLLSASLIVFIITIIIELIRIYIIENLFFRIKLVDYFVGKANKFLYWNEDSVDNDEE